MFNDHICIVSWCSNNEKIFGNLGSVLNQKAKFKTAPFRSKCDRPKINQVKLKKPLNRPNLRGARNLTHAHMRPRSNTNSSRSVLFLKWIIVHCFFLMIFILTINSLDIQ